MTDVSVVVPVYNVEQYLRHCIDSILNQTVHNFELILVDDGSPDKCPMICDEYAELDNRVRVIHKVNGGLSSARNAGIRYAKGKYILFCDSDDFVSPYWIQRLLQQAEHTPNAWIYSNLIRVNDAEKFDFDECVESNFQLTDYYFAYKMGLSAYVWNKIYSTNIIRSYGIAFCEVGHLFEDVDFNLQYLKHCDKYAFIPQALYAYVQRDGSIMHSYTPDWFAMHLSPFYNRIPFIGQENLAEYCDTWLYQFLTFFPLAFDKRSPAPWIQKFMYNQKMLSSKEFQFCLSHASGKNENPIVLKILKTRIYLLYWLFEKAVSIKQRMKKQNTQEEPK